MSDRWVIACVLRSGGDFSVSDVERFVAGVRRAFGTAKPYDIICLSDVPVPLPGVIRAFLLSTWKGWWAKIELFRPNLFSGRPVLYFDLDTVFTGDLSPMLDLEMPEGRFLMLRSWRDPARRASGIMMWRGEFPEIYLAMCSQAEKRVHTQAGDQELIEQALQTLRHMENIETLQGVFPPQWIRSYKRDCLRKESGASFLPEGCRVVCFHGQPRPAFVATRVPWVREALLGSGKEAAV